MTDLCKLYNSLHDSTPKRTAEKHFVTDQIKINARTATLGMISSFCHIMAQLDGPFPLTKHEFFKVMLFIQIFAVYCYTSDYKYIFFRDTPATPSDVSKLTSLSYFIVNNSHYFFWISFISNMIPLREFSNFNYFDVIMYAALCIHILISCIIVFAFLHRRSHAKKLEVLREKTQDRIGDENTSNHVPIIYIDDYQDDKEYSSFLRRKSI
ncbi:hypothetical protein CRE_06928 [Caenorhabditis remanei]|uniref:Uncharacterized protein n=1 Tax=Caenorhabditis remanei TaxID=31234 RepID=E3N6M6_CAERE|nr:hypothetical protein CRE_06928 [Caenorhabditis remanei]